MVDKSPYYSPERQKLRSKYRKEYEVFRSKASKSGQIISYETYTLLKIQSLQDELKTAQEIIADHDIEEAKRDKLQIKTALAFIAENEFWQDGGLQGPDVVLLYNILTTKGKA